MNDQLAFNKAKEMLLLEISNTVGLDQKQAEFAFFSLEKLVLGTVTPFDVVENLQEILLEELMVLVAKDEVTLDGAIRGTQLMEYVFEDKYLAAVQLLRATSVEWADVFALID